MHLRLLARDPFTNVGGSVSELETTDFAERQEFYRFSVHEKYFFEIYSYFFVFLLQRSPHGVNVLSRNFPAYVQDHEMVFTNNSIDSASHRFGTTSFPPILGL